MRHDTWRSFLREEWIKSSSDWLVPSNDLLLEEIKK
jgi:hypothetical protein